MGIAAAPPPPEKQKEVAQSGGAMEEGVEGRGPLPLGIMIMAS